MNHGNPKLASLVDTAIEAIGALLTDPATPPAARLRAAKFILEAVPNHSTPPSQQSAKPAAPATHAATPRPAPKIGRNDYCPCGSGLKYKKCCLLKIEHAHGAPLAESNLAPELKASLRSTTVPPPS